MAVNQGPQITRTGLVAYWDAANEKSFRGLPATNLMYGINYTWANGVNNTYFKVVNGRESAFIPYFNRNIDVTYVDIYNDYNSGSGQCCPSPFYYHTSRVAVTGNTTYMYQIIFKTDNGYYSTNYMYRYEYASNNAYVTEGGLVSASRLESLGDGWFHAWGQFTTNASTTQLDGYLFHYEYLTWNRIRVAAVSLTQGTTIHRPEHLLNLNYRATRGTTVATGGGFLDVVGASTGDITNGPTFDPTNGSSLVFDGVNDFVLTNFVNIGNEMTFEAWVKCTQNISTFNMFMGKYLPYFGFYGGNSLFFSNYINNIQRSIQTPTTLSLNVWYHAVFTTSYSGSKTTMKIFVNGVESATNTFDGTQTNVNNFFMIGDGNNGSNNSWYPFKGNVALVRIFNKTLSNSEILTNYNTTKNKFLLTTNRNIILTRTAANSLGNNSLFSSTLLYLDPGNRQSFIPGHRFWYDLSSNKRRVTLYSNGGTTYRLSASAAPTWSTEGKGTFVFDGVNDFGRIDTEITTTTNFTVSVWVKTTASGDRGIFSHCSGGPVGMGYSVETYMKYWYYSGQWYTLTGNTIINDGTWKNLVWVTSGTNFKMYVNGVLDREVTLVASVITLMRSVGSLWGPCGSDSYGAGQDSYGSVFSGSMGPLIVWNRALNATEVVQLYDNFKSRFPLPNVSSNGLQLYLDSTNTTSFPGTGLTWYDISGNNRNFTIESGVVWRSPGYFFLTDESSSSGFIWDGTLSSATSCTVVIWIKTRDQQSLFFHGQDGGYYLGAYYSTAKEYYQSCGSPDFFVDTIERSNIYDFALDDKWHMLEFKGVNFSTWTSFRFNKYSSFRFHTANLGAIKIYNRYLSAAESLYNYNSMKSKFANTNVSTNGLILNLDAGDGLSYPGTGTTWIDLSGNAVNGTLVNGPTFDTGSGGSLTFDGTNDYAVVNSFSQLPVGAAERSVSIWFRYEDYVATYFSIFGYGVESNGRTFDIGVIRSTQKLFLDSYGGGFGIQSNRSVLPNTWYNVVAIYTGTQQILYLNGGLESSQTVTINTASSNLTIGDMTWATPGLLKGNIGSISLYNRALSRMEVIQNYKATRSRFGLQHVTESLLVHLDAGDITSYQSTGTTWLDISGNKVNGSLQNGPVFSTDNEGNLLFDGTNDNVYINYPLPATFTIEIWIKWISSPSSSYSRIISNSPADNFEVGVNSSRQVSYYPNTSGAWQGNILTLNTTWNLLTITKMGNNITFYLNGSSSYTGSTNASSGTAIYLAKRYTGGEPVNANIGSFRLYSRVLNAEEVSRNFNAERNRFGL